MIVWLYLIPHNKLMKNKTGKKYLIIGGAGFIGTNFADKLLQRKEAVTIFDNFSRRGSLDNAKWLKNKYKNLKIIRGDIRYDRVALEEEMEINDVVFHVAGQVAVT